MAITATRTSARRPAPRASTLAVMAGALVIGLSGCSADEPSAQDATETEATAPADEPDSAASSTDEPASPGTSVDLLDGTRSVDIQTYGDEWVTATVEGGVSTVADPAEVGGVPTAWVVEPLDDGGFHVRSTATTDGLSFCLSLPGDDVITIAPCDPASADQQLEVATLDQADQVNISSPAGVVVADPDSGLALEADPSSPASVFTLVDRGPAES